MQSRTMQISVISTSRAASPSVGRDSLEVLGNRSGMDLSCGCQVRGVLRIRRLQLRRPRQMRDRFGAPAAREHHPADEIVVKRQQWGVGRIARRTSQRRFLKRSEEHTSELQSQSNLVCRLLLEKN